MPDLSTTAECFALLDDADASPDDPRSRLYTGLAGTLSCAHIDALPATLAAMQQALQSGLHAVVLFSYELGAELHGITPREGAAFPSQVLLFKDCKHLSTLEVDHWLDAKTDASPSPAGIAKLGSSVSHAQFDDAIARIHAYIEAGDTYQINYTYRLRFDAYGAPQALYRRLRARQPVPYGALVALPDGRAILSLSPELFIRHEHGTLTARPMKGTAPASGDAQRDAARATALAADPKNRAENLMIVDLLRNDLGRIAKTGTVRVPHLFSVDRYSSVLQMTSTVQAELHDDMQLLDVFNALYPCGSITGAPKRRTMQIVRELESAPRGIYTGAIGWFDPVATPGGLGEFCLSVPIRTLALQPQTGSVREGELGVGAGIVHDSVAADEYAECKLKASFLTGLGSEFELFETMHATREHGCRHLELHMQRLRSSALYFGFAFDENGLRVTLSGHCAALPPNAAHRTRLALRDDGSCTVQSAPLTALALPVRVLLAKETMDSQDLFLRHKSTVRQAYDHAWKAAEAQGAFDMLFFNERDELTEGGRSNVFVKLDGRWFTPPLACGLLPGVMRTVVLADPAWQAEERVITREQLDHAQEIVVCNALRGALPAIVG